MDEESDAVHGAGSDRGGPSAAWREHNVPSDYGIRSVDTRITRRHIQRTCGGWFSEEFRNGTARVCQPGRAVQPAGTGSVHKIPSNHRARAIRNSREVV